MTSQNVVKLHFNPYISCTEPPLQINPDDERHRILELIEEIDHTRGAMLRSSISKARRIDMLRNAIQESVYRLDATGNQKYIPEEARTGYHRTTACKPVFSQAEIDAMRAAGVRFYREPEPRGY